MHLQRAAVRKLGHELGIPKGQLPTDAFKYLTRLHYCAADTDTYGLNAAWGEHEVRRPAMLGMPCICYHSLSLEVLCQHHGPF